MLNRRALLAASANTAMISAAASPAATGSIMPILRPLSGVRRDGIHDDAPALAAIGAAGPVRLPAGSYRLATPLTLPHGLALDAGAVLLVDGVTLTVAGFFDARERTKIFDCRRNGRVIFMPGALIEGYPEWWGARTGDVDFDCLPALRACLLACETMRLAAADYFTSATLKVDIPYRRIHGSGWFGVTAGSATRIILSGPRAGIDTVLQVGPDSAPDSIPDYGFAAGISDLVLTRTAPCVPPSGGEETLAACGLTVRWVVQARIDRVSAIENSIGFYMHDCVYTKFTDCFTQRYNPGTTPEHDITRGFYADGRRKSRWFSGGNASVYIERCNVTASHPAHADPIALKAAGAFCDLFIDHFETSNVPKGCVFSGGGTPNADGGNIDLHIRGAVLDGCTALGLEISAGPAAMTVQLVDVYVALAGSAALAGLAILDGGGTVSIIGGEVHGAATKGALWIFRQTGVQCAGLKLRDTPRPLLLEQAKGCDIQVAINNPSRIADAAALVLDGSVGNYLRPTIIGRAGAFPAGVSFERGESRNNELVTTLIDHAALAGPDRVIVEHGTPVRANGRFGNNNLQSDVRS